MIVYSRTSAALFAATAISLSVACSESPNAPFAERLSVPGSVLFAKAAAGPTVTAASPDFSKRDTTLDVHILGSGFANGATADFLLGGVSDSKVHTNSTRFVSSTEIVANITIDATATPAYRDIAVMSAGKKGIGSEAFVVLDGGEIAVSGLTSLTTSDVSSAGIAVGSGASTTGCGNRGYAWSQATGAKLLPLPSGYCASNAYRVSEGGIVLGNVTKSPTSFELARWTPDGSGSWTIEVIGKPAVGTVFLTSHGVNDVGSVSSSWKNPDGTTLDSWYWNRSTGWRRLARPAGSTFCELEWMNDADQMTGYCHTTGGNGMYWSGPASPAIQLPSPPNGLAGDAFYISQAGTIRGKSTISGVDHTVLWVPNGSGGWNIQDLGTASVADRNDQGSVVIAGQPRAQYVPAGGSTEDLGVHLTGAVMANQSSDGITWIAGYDDAAHPAQRRAFWFKR